MDFKKEYLKYKTKYLHLKNQVGGIFPTHGAAAAGPAAGPAPRPKGWYEIQISDEIGRQMQTVFEGLQMDESFQKDSSDFTYRYRISDYEWGEKGSSYYNRTLNKLKENQYNDIINRLFIRIISSFYRDEVRNYVLIDLENQIYNYRSKRGGREEDFKDSVDHLFPNYLKIIIGQDHRDNTAPARKVQTLFGRDPSYEMFFPLNSVQTEIDDILLKLAFDFIKFIFSREFGQHVTYCNRNLQIPRNLPGVVGFPGNSCLPGGFSGPPERHYWQRMGDLINYLNDPDRLSRIEYAQSELNKIPEKQERLQDNRQIILDLNQKLGELKNDYERLQHYFENSMDDQERREIRLRANEIEGEGNNMEEHLRYLENTNQELQEDIDNESSIRSYLQEMEQEEANIRDELNSRNMQLVTQMDANIVILTGDRFRWDAGV